MLSIYISLFRKLFSLKLYGSVKYVVGTRRTIRTEPSLLASVFILGRRSPPAPQCEKDSPKFEVGGPYLYRHNRENIRLS